MKKFNRHLAACLLLTAWAPWTLAQKFPDRAITIVVPAPAGGTTDLAARALQDPLSKALGVPVVIENKGGANGVVGAQAVLAAKADGYTYLMQVSGFHTMTPHMLKLPYDPLKDLQAVGNVLSAPQVLVVRSSLTEVQSHRDLVNYAWARPGKLNYASTGNGSGQHVTAELYKSLTGIFATHIPYRGTGGMVADLLGGQVDFTFTTAPPVLQHIRSGQLKALMVTSRKRLASLPDVPTAEEVGLRNFEVATWLALFTHSRAPKETVDRVSEEMRKLMSTAAFRGRASDLGAEASYLDPVQLNAFAAAEFIRWGRVIKRANIRAD